MSDVVGGGPMLRVVWRPRPQTPSAQFTWRVPTVAEGEWLLAMLTSYDYFEYSNGFKPACAGVGEVQRLSGEDYQWHDIEEEEK